jgi:hypothetical protein
MRMLLIVPKPYDDQHCVITYCSLYGGFPFVELPKTEGHKSAGKWAHMGPLCPCAHMGQWAYMGPHGPMGHIGPYGPMGAT